MPVEVKDLPPLEELNYLFELAPEGSGLRWRVDRGRRKLAGKLAGSRQTNSDGKQYWRVRFSERLFCAHRIVWAITNGELPPTDMQIDHINGDGLDNRPENLRLATSQQNTRNRQGAQRNSKSGIRGVSEVKKTGKWRADIQANGRRIDLGRFKDPLEAKLARFLAELEHGYHDGSPGRG